MPPTENYQYPHGYFTPEPHCIPGYTGYLPGFGPHKQYQFGKTYGKMTHDIMEAHPVAGERFGPILQWDGRGDMASEDELLAWEREQNSSKHVLRRGMVPGYTGHVPRKQFISCQSYEPQCQKGIGDFERYQMDCKDKYRSHKYAPPEDLLPRTVIFPKRLCERPKHREVPAYATFTNPMNYGESVYNMSDLDPRKTYLPGYTGYYTGKCFDTGVTHGQGAHQDLCDLTSSRLERRVVEKRPNIDDWYRPSVPRPPRTPLLDGYHSPAFKTSNPVPGYAGHIPGYRDCDNGHTFGKVTGDILRERQLNS
ncbi:hypothetical protein JTE90_005777 [Oedothorax gibbosus]|uniref:Ciliary microtubule inner protein 2A-C-like domain-containing protein n=1 Tax=Oedothorax gibbosus TaxID=931172 RepID=A0AAV6UT50_9ARAC|nr:hypothetical protein JTE90_005777 [Oedothorax gibbosus]